MSDRALRNVDLILGDGPRSEAPRRSGGFRSGPKRTQARKTTPEKRTPARNTRPSEVTEDVWRLAEQWIELGTSALNGNRPYVSHYEFAKRFSTKCNEFRPLRKFRKEFGQEHTVSVLTFMIEFFWDGLTEGDTDAVHQMKFLRDDWESLFDRATTAFAVQAIRNTEQSGRRYEPTPPSENNYLNLVEQRRLEHWQALAVADEAPPAPQGDLRARWSATESAATLANRQKGTTTNDS